MHRGVVVVSRGALDCEAAKEKEKEEEEEKEEKKKKEKKGKKKKTKEEEESLLESWCCNGDGGRNRDQITPCTGDTKVKTTH